MMTWDQLILPHEMKRVLKFYSNILDSDASSVANGSPNSLPLVGRKQPRDYSITNV